jgi:hypothetical protein
LLEIAGQSLENELRAISTSSISIESSSETETEIETEIDQRLKERSGDLDDHDNDTYDRNGRRMYELGRLHQILAIRESERRAFEDSSAKDKDSNSKLLRVANDVIGGISRTFLPKIQKAVVDTINHVDLKNKKNDN